MTGLSFTELRAVYRHARDTWRANRHDVHTIRDYWPECVRQALEEKAERADDLQPEFVAARPKPTPGARERMRAMLGLPATGLAVLLAAGADARPAFAAEESLARVMSGLRARFMLDEQAAVELQRAVHEFAVHLSYTGPTYAEALARIEDALAHPGFDRDALATLRERLEQVATATPAPAFTVTNSTGVTMRDSILQFFGALTLTLVVLAAACAFRYRPAPAVQGGRCVLDARAEGMRF